MREVRVRTAELRASTRAFDACGRASQLTGRCVPPHSAAGTRLRRRSRQREPSLCMLSARVESVPSMLCGSGCGAADGVYDAACGAFCVRPGVLIEWMPLGPREACKRARDCRPLRILIAGSARITCCITFVRVMRARVAKRDAGGLWPNQSGMDSFSSACQH